MVVVVLVDQARSTATALRFLSMTRHPTRLTVITVEAPGSIIAFVKHRIALLDQSRQLGGDDENAANARDESDDHEGSGSSTCSRKETCTV